MDPDAVPSPGARAVDEGERGREGQLEEEGRGGGTTVRARAELCPSVTLSPRPSAWSPTIQERDDALGCCVTVDRDHQEDGPDSVGGGGLTSLGGGRERAVAARRRRTTSAYAARNESSHPRLFV